MTLPTSGAGPVLTTDVASGLPADLPGQSTSSRGDSATGTDQRPVLLVIEAGDDLTQMLSHPDRNFQVVRTDDRDGAINLMRRHDPVVVAIDLDRSEQPGPPLESQLLDSLGLAVASGAQSGQAKALRTLQDLLALSPAARIIALTAPGDREAGVRAIALGAHDVFDKPVDGEALSLIIDRALRIADLEQESNRRLEALAPSGIEGVVTRDPKMLRVCRTVVELAQSRDTALLQGEPGVGKHLLAQAMHLLSPRSEHRFAVVRCTTADVGRIESELFGVDQLAPVVEPTDALTDAPPGAPAALPPDTAPTPGTPPTGGSPGSPQVWVRTYPGKLELANGGTLFLDEVSELSPALQLRLLHFLEDRTITRRGSLEEISLDVRIICATRRDLNEMAARGQFHAGLAYLLSETSVKVPPLRERSGDAALLAHAVLRRLGRRHGRNRLTFSEAALDAIGSYAFPGNVHELENAVRHAVVTVSGRTIHPADLGLSAADSPNLLNLRRIRDDAERQAVLRVMARADGNVARAAELLGISRPTLYDLLNRFGLR